MQDLSLFFIYIYETSYIVELKQQLSLNKYFMRIFLTALVFLCTVLGMAQNSQTGYIITKDGKRYNEIKILNPNYADSYERLHVEFAPVGMENYIYPKDIAVYGTDQGYRYISATLELYGNEHEAFLKELIRDNEVNIYKYEDRNGTKYYTINKKSGKYELIEDNGKEFRNSLRKMAANCSIADKLDKIPMKMTDNSLLSLYESYTNCSMNNFPGIKWGVAINTGYSFFNFDDEARFEIPNQAYAMPGVFVDIPIDRRISFRPEIYYFYTQTKSKSKNIVTKNYDFTYLRHSLIVPLMLRYRFSNINGNTIPYIEMGATFDFKLVGEMYRTENNYGRFDRLKQSGAIMNVGPEFGAGIEHTLKNDMVLYAGARGAYYFSATSSEKKEHRSNVSVNIGIGF